MAAFGRQTLIAAGNQIQVTADGKPEWKTGGVTIDWNTVVAISGSDFQIPIELTTVPVGQKYLRYGQVLTKITVPATDVVTIGGTPTGGTFTLTITAGGVTTTTNPAFNAAASAVQTAVQALSNVGAGKATVTGSAGGPYTFVFDNSLGAVTVGGSITGLTGGAPTFAVAVTAPGGDVGKFGPYDPAATDGRATLTRGECFILNETVLQNGIIPALGAGATDYPAALEGGSVYKDRLLQSGVAGHTLALGPTLAELLAAFPRLRLVEN